MKPKTTYHHPHSAFKLDGVCYDAKGLSKLADQLIRKGEAYQNALGHFIHQWLNSDVEVTLQTSGSTGVPKTVAMAKQAMVNSAMATGSYFGLQAGDSALSCLPFEYIAAKMMFVRAYVLGLELDCVKPSSNPLITITRAYDFCALVPLQLENSVEHLHRIKTLIVGGAPLSEGLKTKLKNASTAIYETFGMTETVSHIAVKNISKSATVFEALPSVSIGVDARDCLWIEAPQLLSSQIQTNDVVNLISKSTFEWVGRYDTIINSGGIKIAPEQLEQHLEGFIQNRFFITSQKDEVLGHAVVLVIESSTPYKTLNFETLDPHKRPKHIYYIDQFLETVSGKIKRQATLDLLRVQ